MTTCSCSGEAKLQYDENGHRIIAPEYMELWHFIRRLKRSKEVRLHFVSIHLRWTRNPDAVPYVGIVCFWAIVGGSLLSPVLEQVEADEGLLRNELRLDWN